MENKKEGNKNSGSSLLHTVFNHTKYNASAGLVALSYALEESGLVSGSIIAVLISVFAAYSLMVLIESGGPLKVTTFEGYMEKAFGIYGYLIALICVIFFLFIECVALNIIIAENLLPLLEEIFGMDCRKNLPILCNVVTIRLIVNVLIIIPVGFFRNVGSLAKLSGVTLLGTAFCVIVIVIRFFTYLDDTIFMHTVGNDTVTLIFNKQEPIRIMNTLSLFVRAYAGSQTLALMLFQSMASPTIQRWNTATFFTMLALNFLYVPDAIFGYLTFRSHIQSNIFLNYCDTDTLINVTRGIFGIQLIASYTLYNFNIILSIEKIIYGKILRSADKSQSSENLELVKNGEKEETESTKQLQRYESMSDSNDGEKGSADDEKEDQKVKSSENNEPKVMQAPLVVHIIVDCCSVTAAFMTSVIFDDLTAIFEYQSVLGTIPLAFIMVPMTAIVLDGKPYFKLANAVKMICLLVGIFVLVISFISSTIAIRERNQNVILENIKPYCFTNETTFM